MHTGHLSALADWLAKQTGANDARIIDANKLSGGAIQENWLIDAEMSGGLMPGRSALVLRTDSPSSMIQSLSREQEFALLEVAKTANIEVPQPLFLESVGSLIGKPFYVMRCVAGTANPRTLTKDPKIEPRRRKLTAELGREIAKLHSIEFPHPKLGFLGPAPKNPAAFRAESFLEQLDALPSPLPILEWSSRWLAQNAPSSDRVTLCHGDYRTGNIMIDQARITGILDWEFASWSDPMEDIGWLCARCWRFGMDNKEAGGLGERVDLYRGYEAETGGPINWSTVSYWETMATVRWAIIAHHQGLRHASSAELSIELALTGRKAAEMEYDALMQIRCIEEGA